MLKSTKAVIIGLSPIPMGERWRSRIGGFSGPYPLISVLLLATLLRVWGLTWGLPSATHYFSYHPDESRILEVAMFSMNLFKGKMLPHFYNYPSLQIYLVNIANSTAYLFGAVDIVPKDPSVWYPQWARMYLIGRYLTVIMGVGTVWATYILGTHLWGRRAGLLAALILAIIPLHAQHSHWLTVDVPATFWGVLSLIWTVRLMQADPKPLRAALWAGIFAGLAAATKYNMALVLLPLILACTLPSLTGRGGEPLASRGGSVIRLVTGLLAAVVAFLIACPGVVLETHKFLTDLHTEAVHVSNPDDPTFKGTGNGFVFHLTQNLNAGLGLPLLLLALGSIGYALYRRESGDGLLAVFALPYYVVIGLAAVRYARYVVPLLPILALWSGRLLADLSRLPKPIWRRSAIAAGAVILVLTLGDCLLIVRPMAMRDPRDNAMAWLNVSAPAPTRIGFPVLPWFGTVPISPYFTAPRPGAWSSQTSPATAARIVYAGNDWDAVLLQTKQPKLVILSEYDYRDVLRLHDAGFERYMAILSQQYKVVFPQTYPHQPRDFGLTRGEFGLPLHNLPYDMFYTNPAIVIFQRK